MKKYRYVFDREELTEIYFRARNNDLETFLKRFCAWECNKLEKVKKPKK